MATNWDDVVNDPDVTSTFGANLSEQDILPLLESKLTDEEVQELSNKLHDLASKAKTRKTIVDVLVFAGRIVKRLV